MSIGLGRPVGNRRPVGWPRSNPPAPEQRGHFRSIVIKRPKRAAPGRPATSARRRAIRAGDNSMPASRPESRSTSGASAASSPDPSARPPPISDATGLDRENSAATLILGQHSRAGRPMPAETRKQQS